jgi:hypothetical protein
LEQMGKVDTSERFSWRGVACGPRNIKCLGGLWGCDCIVTGVKVEPSDPSIQQEEEHYDGWLARTSTTAAPKLLPEHCHVCNHHNPYVGKEHLTPGAGAPPGYTGPDMVYVCRTCKPAWDRKERIEHMKCEAAEREAKKTDYSSITYQGSIDAIKRVWGKP